MSHRFLNGAAPLGLVLFAVAMATPALARDADDDHHARGGHRAYDHYVRDANDHHSHHVTDRRNSVGHAVGDLFRYGTTNPYSSPGHFYRDQHRADHHYSHDQHSSYRHYSRDGHQAAHGHYGNQAYGHGHHDSRH